MEVDVRRVITIVASAALIAAGAASPAQAALPRSADGAEAQYLVLYKDGANPADAQKAIEAAGGNVLTVNTDVGVATVSSADPGFTNAVKGASAIEGVARNRAIGSVPAESRVMATAAQVAAAKAAAGVETEGREGATPFGFKRNVKDE